MGAGGHSSNATGSRKTMNTRILVAALLAVWMAPLASGQIYVWRSAPGTADGDTWDTAWRTIDDALADADVGPHAVEEIWVAAGSYMPQFSIGYDIDDNLAGWAIYGGFDGTEPTLDDRAELYSQTIITGDSGVPGDNSDNKKMLFRIHTSSETVPFTIDGFVIEEGNNQAQTWPYSGGAIGIWDDLENYPCWVIIRNTTFRNNHSELHGGAIWVDSGSLQLENCSFLGNSAKSEGGAIFQKQLQGTEENSSDDWGSAFVNCVFANNTGGNGGAIHVGSFAGPGDLLLQNCLMYGNAAAATSGGRGGAIYIESPVGAGGVAVVNCTITQNTCSQFGFGAGIYAEVSTWESHVRDSIVWGNTIPATISGGDIDGPGTVLGGSMNPVQVSYSDVEYFQGVHPGPGNIDANPKFKNPSLLNFRLRAASPCKNSGSDPLVWRDVLDLDRDGDRGEKTPYDLNGGNRFVNVVDMGCYERGGSQ